MSTIQIIIAAIVTLGVLVTVHEYGHFWVARRCGVKVLRFSIGFGRPLWRWYDRQGTEYVIAAIPLGGYVKMLDEREAEVAPQELENAFNRKSVGQRIAIVVAGPAANFLFAILVYWLFFVIGVSTVKPVIGQLTPGSVAAEVALPVGHEIIAIDGVETKTWQAVNIQLLSHIGETGELELTTRSLDGLQQQQSRIAVSQWLSQQEQPDPLADLGIMPYIPEASTRIGVVVDDSAASRAGLLAKDRVVSLNGETITGWRHFVELIEGYPDRKIQLQVERDGRLLYLDATPEGREGNDGVVKGFLGIGPESVAWPEEMRRDISYSVLSAWGPAVVKTWDMSVLTLVSLKKIVTGQISVKNLSGPITIAKVAGSSVNQGINAYLGFLAYLSISLGIINILPIPVLDGGHLMYYLAEWVRGKPVSEKTQMLGLRIGLSLIVGLMVLALYNDILRLW